VLMGTETEAGAGSVGLVIGEEGMPLDCVVFVKHGEPLPKIRVQRV
jgi:hypothetical protein